MLVFEMLTVKYFRYENIPLHTCSKHIKNANYKEKTTRNFQHKERKPLTSRFYPTHTFPKKK